MLTLSTSINLTFRHANRPKLNKARPEMNMPNLRPLLASLELELQLKVDKSKISKLQSLKK